ncbi:hypothetical protein OSB04_011247 [Centaurea solstitialis]|uniref:Uncharacterized protein n=1 Tax=Centaurea solstitialis TaxID=347529 RepID=A0AA38T925_9ASTR|nr:hypothetical protein OSB04_011247 [Centaurea solstitialis]
MKKKIASYFFKTLASHGLPPPFSVGQRKLWLSPPRPSLCLIKTTPLQCVWVLDGVKVSYASWVNLFKLTARAYKVMAHIDRTPSPEATNAYYEAWSKLDTIVLQWIYGSLSNDLLVRVLQPESTARQAWVRVEKIFLNNKGSRAAALNHEFTNLTLNAMPSLEAYCQRIKELSDQFNVVDITVTENQLVLQLVRGLPPEYDTTAAYINQSLPS